MHITGQTIRGILVPRFKMGNTRRHTPKMMSFKNTINKDTPAWHYHCLIGSFWQAFPTILQRAPTKRAKDRVPWQLRHAAPQLEVPTPPFIYGVVELKVKNSAFYLLRDGD